MQHTGDPDLISGKVCEQLRAYLGSPVQCAVMLQAHFCCILQRDRKVIHELGFCGVPEAFKSDLLLGNGLHQSFSCCKFACRFGWGKSSVAVD